MDIDYLRKNNLILLECISGSKAYGLNLPTSDTDIKGVFVLPEKHYFGLDYIEQISNESNDIVFYELKRFVELLLKNNPNLLELLNIPTDCLISRHPLMEKLKQEMFLSKLCRFTFADYAMAQIKKAKGLNKKISNPMEKERKSVLDFCYVSEGQGAIPLKVWLNQRGYFQEYCGLVNIPHMNEIYGLYYDEKAHKTAGKEVLGYRGIMQKDTANEVSLSSIPKEEKPEAIMSFNKNGYSSYCKDYKEYWEWVEKRNDVRYAGTVSHGKNYDAKNMMHVFRLLDMAEEIATTKSIQTRRPNREFLLSIRRGDHMYEDLVKTAEERIEKIKELYENSDLPETPDRERAEESLVEIRKKSLNWD